MADNDKSIEMLSDAVFQLTFCLVNLRSAISELSDDLSISPATRKKISDEVHSTTEPVNRIIKALQGLGKMN